MKIKFLFLLMAVVALQSCMHIEKRHYRKGFYVQFKHKVGTPEAELVDVVMEPEQVEQITMVPTIQDQVTDTTCEKIVGTVSRVTDNSGRWIGQPIQQDQPKKIERQASRPTIIVAPTIVAKTTNTGNPQKERAFFIAFGWIFAVIGVFCLAFGGIIAGIIFVCLAALFFILALVTDPYPPLD